jgi:hypothetical protein
VELKGLKPGDCIGWELIHQRSQLRRRCRYADEAALEFAFWLFRIFVVILIGTFADEEPVGIIQAAASTSPFLGMLFEKPGNAGVIRAPPRHPVLFILCGSQLKAHKLGAFRLAVFHQPISENVPCCIVERVEFAVAQQGLKIV